MTTPSPCAATRRSFAAAARAVAASIALACTVAGSAAGPFAGAVAGSAGRTVLGTVAGIVAGTVAGTLATPGDARAAARPDKAKKAATTGGYSARADVAAFIDELVRNDGFSRRALADVFAHARRQQGVIDAMSRPVLQPPKWFEYVPQFVNPARIAAGEEFWRLHEKLLARAEGEFGVPAEVVVAILGVETLYGRNTGAHRVVDALTTLAFDYPRRAEFFRRELRQYLLLARELDVSPLAPRGSFAGAMGVPQFMPGSYRTYAVDYDGDGRIDLWRSSADVIGSVANYLARHDWMRGRPVMVTARIEAGAEETIGRKLDGGISERRTLEAWRRDGVLPEIERDAEEGDLAGLVLLELAEGPSYRLGFGNFYVITRYNRSRLYASAVWDLAQALRERRSAGAAGARQEAGDPSRVEGRGPAPDAGVAPGPRPDAGVTLAPPPAAAR